jgi:hypothetical protein
MTTADDCQKDLSRWGQQYAHRVMEDTTSWNYRPLLTKHGCDDWSFCVKSQYDVDRRIGRVFRWHRSRTEASKPSLAAEFKEYADKWWSETRLLSSIQSKVFNPNYQRIIGLGRAALPFIFSDLKQRGGQWYWALECITGENPAAHATTLDEAKRSWLDYAAEKGYLPQ